MSKISRSKIKTVVSQYCIGHVKDESVMYTIICFIQKQGDHYEGSLIYSDNMTSNDTIAIIAPEYKSQHSQPTVDTTIDRLTILQHMYSQPHDRFLFCAELRNNYNMKTGPACKLYQRFKSEITEGVAYNINVHFSSGPQYPMCLHLRIFTDKAYRTKLFYLLADTNWFDVQQISDKKHLNMFTDELSVSMDAETWVEECKKSFQNNNDPLIPLVIETNGKWIEWVKVVHIHLNGAYMGDVGVSFKYHSYNERWSVESIYLDCNTINDKHQSSGMRRGGYVNQLNNFQARISQVIFIDWSIIQENVVNM